MRRLLERRAERASSSQNCTAAGDAVQPFCQGVRHVGQSADVDRHILEEGMKLVKVFGALVATILLFVVVFNFSAVESRFQCSGEISSDGNSQSATVYMKLAKYRWWVGLWSDSDGAVWVEIPNVTIDYFEHVEVVGDQLHIYEMYPQQVPKGNFSNLSKALAINIPAAGFFEGGCRSADR
jgi:hypothetical protein